jgi:hypothetical protein
LNTENNVIEINGLTKRFKDVLAVDELSFEVHSGDVFGFLGPKRCRKKYHNQDDTFTDYANFWNDKNFWKNSE